MSSGGHLSCGMLEFQSALGRVSLAPWGAGIPVGDENCMYDVYVVFVCVQLVRNGMGSARDSVDAALGIQQSFRHKAVIFEKEI